MIGYSPPPWTRRAACAGLPPTMFFPAEPPDPTPENRHPKPPPFDVRPALAVCAKCEVRVECLIAFKDEPFGVFGGTTSSQRGYGRADRTRQGDAA